MSRCMCRKHAVVTMCVCVCLYIWNYDFLFKGSKNQEELTDGTEWKGEEKSEGRRENVKHAVTRHNTQTHVPQVHVHKQQVTKHVGTPLQTTQHFMFKDIHTLFQSVLRWLTYKSSTHNLLLVVICLTLQCPHRKLHWQCRILMIIN